MKKLFDVKEFIKDAKDALIGGGYEYALNKVTLMISDKLPEKVQPFADSIAALVIRILLNKTKIIKNKETLLYLRKKTAAEILQGVMRATGMPTLTAMTPYLEATEEDMDMVIEALEDEFSMADTLEIQGGDLYGTQATIEAVEITGSNNDLYGTNGDSDGGLYS